MSEANPFTLIPGYSDIIELFKKGELSDDAMGVLGKLRNVIVTGIKWGTGKSTDTYRNFEDTAGQLFQLFTPGEYLLALHRLCHAQAQLDAFMMQSLAERSDDTALDGLNLGLDHLVGHQHLHQGQLCDDRRHVLHAGSDAAQLRGHAVAHRQPLQHEVLLREILRFQLGLFFSAGHTCRNSHPRGMNLLAQIVP